MDEARRAFNQIRLEYHPDKGTHLDAAQSARNARFLRLAEEAYRMLQQKERVRSSIRCVQSTLDKMDNVFSKTSMDQMLARRSAHTSSYSYENCNGVVRESGYIDGRPMTEQQLHAQRSPYTRLL